MKIKTIELIIQNFIVNSNPGVIAIKGKWGIGKTHTWTQILEREKSNLALKKYCYVSLFGISSINELSLAIFTKTQDAKLLGEKCFIKSLWENTPDYWQSAGKKLVNFARSLDFPYSKNIGISLERIAPYFMNDTIICIDDFERNTEITPEKLLGYISFLKEEKRCKVALIFNDEALTDEKKKAYAAYREKVIDVELLFSTTPEDAFDIAIPLGFENRELLKEYVLKLKINNIRILFKILETLKLIAAHLEGVSSEIAKHVIPAVILFNWVYYDRAGEKPTMDFVLQWNSLAWSIKKSKDPEEQKRYEAWSALIQAYGFTHIDELDISISKVVQHGHCEETGLEEAIKNMNISIQHEGQQQEFKAAWELFHDSFTSNENLIVTSLEKGFKKGYEFITPINVNATVKLMRDLNRNDVADKLIDFYVDRRSNEPSLFDLDSYPFANDLDDEKLRKAFRKAYEASRTYQSLKEVSLLISKSNGWSEDALHVMQNASEEDFYQLFTNTQGKELGRLIKGCLYFQSVAGMEHISDKPKQALKRIGQESKLNALRVKRYGIEV